MEYSVCGVQVTDLRCKEVINICDGMRMGYVADVTVQIPQGQVMALVVPGPCKLFKILWRKEDCVIPWHCIRRRGDDIILVEAGPEQCKVPRPKQKRH